MTQRHYILRTLLISVLACTVFHTINAQDSICLKPLVSNVSKPFNVTNGLQGRHIALWASHGLYYELADARWEWQRARMFQTVEDKLPTDFVINYLTPMLENAGAVVIMPRERDPNPNMLVVDNDRPSDSYRESNGIHKWETGNNPGFACLKNVYRDFENPFTEGSYRQTETTTDSNNISSITWTFSSDECKGMNKMAVYVAYKTVENSTDNARYTVLHNGQKTTFYVNQKMGGGTWIYLGTFLLRNGDKVILTNLADSAGMVVTADAVRFGGGMGNIARHADGTKYYQNTKIKKGNAQVTEKKEWQPVVDIPWETSGYPRFAEGARYYLQWAGMPDRIYSPSHGKNDYTDDFKCRGEWVNYLMRGAKASPKEMGLKIPIDCSLALHTDGGSVGGDRIIGSLGIFSSYENSEKAAYCSTVYNTVINDIRKLAEPKWTGRGCVDRKYNEAWVPRVPAMILEMLSHESFGEMRYALDPRFRFIVSRAIYKGMLKFLAKHNGTSYTVQPLPVRNFCITRENDNDICLCWQATPDSLEKTATPERYVVYTRVGDGDFDNGCVVCDSSYRCTIPVGKVVSFKVCALNNGGLSFPSEILSAGIPQAQNQGKQKTVLVINGFDRISAPDDFSTSDDNRAGFLAEEDNGVPYIEAVDFIGRQKEFRRSMKMTDDDSPGFGDSYGNAEKWVLAGNNFDYPAVHGEALMKAGYSFVSYSRTTAEKMIPLATDSLHTLNTQYVMIDLILGKQKQCKFGRKGNRKMQFKTFSNEMKELLTAYCRNGGSVFVSGAFVGTDLWHNTIATTLETDKKFAEKILKYKWRDSKAAKVGVAKMIASPLNTIEQNIEFYDAPNTECYYVEAPDAIIPADNTTMTFMRYKENGQSAAIVFTGNTTDKWKTVVMGFPFETIKNDRIRQTLMKSITDVLIEK